MQNLIKKSPKIVLSFPTSTEAYLMEEAVQRYALNGRMIPVPREISASCGLAFMMEPAEEARVNEVMQKEKIRPEGRFELML